MTLNLTMPTEQDLKPRITLAPDGGMPVVLRRR